jgi:DNA/RNA-binding domain of Phe-tRNA-synthetase-like protein
MGLACSLPDGRTVSVAEEAADRLLCGVIVVDHIRVDESGGAAEDTAAMGPELRVMHAGRLPSEIALLAEARQLYKSFGMDPSRHRPSSEALLRRVLKGQDLYRINNAVDSCNLASLTMVLPIGMYDLALVQGDVQLRTGAAGEEYPGIRKGPVHLEGRLGLFDREGPFGSPTSDSARTSVSSATESLLAIVMATASYPIEKMQMNLELFGKIFATHCSGTTAFQAVIGKGDGA